MSEVHYHTHNTYNYYSGSEQSHEEPQRRPGVIYTPPVPPSRGPEPEFKPKACPFCGGSAIIRKDPWFGFNTVGCLDPDCAGHKAAVDDSKVTAYRAWNKRSDPKPGAEYWR